MTRILVAATLLAAAPFAPGQDSSAPNIILILADDQGWNHLSVPMDDELPGSGSDYFQTPNIDRIAAAGMRFPNAYAAAPMCGPSRVALHYGKGTAQVMYSEAADDVRKASITIGEMMQSVGYATAHFGKWSPGAPESRPSSSIYLENHKLLKFYDSGELQLFDIAGDPREQQDLAGRMPERAEELHRRLTEYLDAVNATIPDPSTMTSGAGPGAGMGMGAGAMGMGAGAIEFDAGAMSMGGGAMGMGGGL